MSWTFGAIVFEDYGIYVSKSEGLLDFPTLQFDGTDWLDLDGLDYNANKTPKYNPRQITLSCFLIAKADEEEELTGYEVFRQKVSDFFDAVKAQGFVIFYTPYATIENLCAVQDGISIDRETHFDDETQVGTFSLVINVQGDSEYLSIPVYDWKTFLVKGYLVTNNLQVSRTLQGDSYATCSYETKDKPSFHIWDYFFINTNGVRSEPYYFLSEPEITKVSTNKFSVSVRGEHGSILLNQATFTNMLKESTFFMYGNLEDIIDMMITCANRFVGLEKFVKGTIEATNNKLHQFSNERCFDLLKRLCQEYELEFDVKWPTVSGVTYTIHCKKEITATKAITLQYGKGLGLLSLQRGFPNRGELVTCLYAYGSNKNLPMDYRGGQDRLVFEGNPLKKNDLEYMAVELSKTWDNIFPQLDVQVGSYSQKLKEDMELVNDPDLYAFPNGKFCIHAVLAFDIAAVTRGGETAKVSMLTGDCAGLNFDVKLHDKDADDIYLIQYEDEAGNKYPNADFHPNANDHFTLVNIEQDVSYIAAAELLLKQTAQKYLDKYCYLRYPYKCDVDPDVSDYYSEKFEVGDRVTVIDPDFDLNGLLRIGSFTYDVISRKYSLNFIE